MDEDYIAKRRKQELEVIKRVALSHGETAWNVALFFELLSAIYSAIARAQPEEYDNALIKLGAFSKPSGYSSQIEALHESIAAFSASYDLSQISHEIISALQH